WLGHGSAAGVVAVADDTGGFALTAVPQTAAIAAIAPFHRAAASTAAVRAGETADCQLAMARAARVRGRVVDAAGAPIAAAELAFRGPDRNDRADLPVDRAGRFDFDATAAGGELAVRAPGFTSARRRLAPDSGPWLDVAIRLEPEPQLALRLAFPDGTAAAGWAVRWCSEPDSALAPSEQQVATDATGECRIAAPLGAAPARWAVRGPGDPVWHRMPVAALARDGEARRRATVPTDLLPSATLTATCLGVDDRPLQNARVYLQLHDDTAWESARTDDRGRFAAGPLAPGSYTVFAESTAPDQPTLRHTGALLQAGGHAELELRAGSSGVLDYALRRADDRPIRAAVVTFVGGSPARRYGARESASGRQRLPAGDYALYAMGEDFAWIDGTPFTIVADETLRLELPVEPAARRALALQGVPGLGERLFVAELRRRSDRRPFGSFRILRDAPPSLNAFLPRGDYELDLRALADDRAWHGGFTVESVAPRHAAIAVPLAPR
ncbi:MAG: carboxypeptidase regulatory-like domain-containing protein, partial [Planctomycetes bacterium]|nr:carboxypeptidase regulatory-like domain-containing protein [Planctomycetota bacterium]